jgi:hypothetical protein
MLMVKLVKINWSVTYTLMRPSLLRGKRLNFSQRVSMADANSPS